MQDAELARKTVYVTSWMAFMHNEISTETKDRSQQIDTDSASQLFDDRTEMGREGLAPSVTSPEGVLAETLMRVGADECDAFFRHALGGVDEPTAPFGVIDVLGDARDIHEARQIIGAPWAPILRARAERTGTTVSSLFHAAWGLVVAHTSGRDDVVFGTVLRATRELGAQAQRMFGEPRNTVPLRLEITALTAKELVHRTRQQLIELSSYAPAPLALVQGCSGISGSAPLFTAILDYRQSSFDSQTDSADATVRALAQSETRANYPIAITVDDAGEEFMITVRTDRRIDPRRVIGYFETAVQSLAQALEQAPLTPALALSILPQSERQKIVEAFNATQVSYPQGKLIHQLFEEQVERTPDAAAVVYGEQALTYSELNRKANQLAWCLRSRGVGPDELVALCVERSLEMLVGLLGILKAGGAYVPLDPTNPSERLEHVLTDANPRVLLTLERFKGSLPLVAAEVISLDGNWHEIETHDERNPSAAQTGATAQHLAYVIYTSGSTGTPKGVMVEHRNIVNYALYAAQRFDIAAGTGSLVCSSISFDLMLTGLYPTLLAGRAVRLCSNQLGLAALPSEILRCVNLGLLKLTPSHLSLLNRSLSDEQLAGRVRVLVVGGEPLQASAVQRWRTHAPNTRIFNHYGPTETTVGCVVHELSEHDCGAVPIGKPIANTQVYILNRYLQPVPIGTPGEIYVGGAGVARGYWRRPDLTAARFVRDPFSTVPQARLYKTGDIGRWRPDGEIEYLGRNDLQVKIRGFRVELGEVEAQLLAYPAVKDAAVIAREDVPGEKSLVAYVIPLNPSSSVDSGLSAEALRAHLKRTLPDYMVPAAFVILEHFPLTPNGKLDRRALPTPDFGAYSSRPYEAPAGEIERRLAQIWQEILRQERVGRQDNFFELGGHSLLIVQMTEQLRQVGLFAELHDVYESPTLADLGSKLKRELPDEFEVPPNRIPESCEVITPEMLPLIALDPEQIDHIARSVPGGAGNIQDIYPLAPLQEGILFHHLLNERGGDTYILPTLLSVASRQKLDDLIAALQSVIDRHAILRSAVLWEQLPRPLQVVYRRATLPVQELYLDSNRDGLEQLAEEMTPRRQRLDLRQAPLIRLKVAKEPRTAQWYALLQMHHLIGDHVSSEIVFAELLAHLQGHQQDLPEPVAYRDHVAQALAHARAHDPEEFFRNRLGDIDEPTAPFGCTDVRADGSLLKEARQRVDMTLAQRIRAHARRLKVSAATLFHAVWGLVISRTSGRHDVVFGTVLLGRLLGSAGARPVLGMFINTLPLRLRLQDVTAREFVEQTQRELVDLLKYEQTSLAVAQRCSGVSGSTPLFTALLNCLHGAADPIAEEAAAEAGIRLLERREWTNYPISLSVNDLGEAFDLMAQTNQTIDPRQLIAYVTTAMQSLLEALESEPQRPVLGLSVLPEEEQNQILEGFNATQIVAPHGKLVHQMFEEQVARTPEAIAVIHDGEALSYAQLNHKANRVAQILRSQGVQNGQLVAICVERSPELIYGLLGILKAGGAYVPLDPNYPAERLHYMLEDAKPTVLLIQQHLRARLPRTGVRILALDYDTDGLEPADPGNVDAHALNLHPENLAYVIYTSGSTGQPKGVLVEHHSLTNLVRWHIQEFRLDAGTRSASMAGLGFDATTWEIWPPLCSGGTLLLPPREAASNPQQLLQWWQRQDLDISFLVTPLAELAYASGMVNTRVRTVLIGGDRLRRWPDSLPDGQQLVNNYGPTETTVVATSGTLDAQDPVLHIGRPIANTRVYVLDGSMQPVPKGVMGEIYIGGSGVGRGYLNRPELTAERFKKDPFSSNPRGRMYKTGDLGRWRADGTLEYLGRNDHQVKIRGFRVEPGEIEVHLARHAHVKESAVLAREDVPGERRLVAYVVLSNAHSETSVESLRGHLASTLPDHMIPTAFVILDHLPLNSSGKVDRLALPAPDLDAYAHQRFEAPQSEIEEALSEIWQQVLRVAQVGRQDNFFDLGGHSLSALQLTLRVNQHFGSALTVATVYNSPTLRALAARIRGEAVTDEFVDLSKEATLDDSITAHPGGPVMAPAQAVLLTGCTGFVGRFLLAELLRNTDAIVYCLVRARATEEAAARLRTTLQKWDLWSDDFESRVVAVPCDLSLPHLGLDGVAYQMLCNDVDSIYHCGTSMNHLETYEMAKRVNVEANRELLKIATQGKPKLINYISTLGVFSFHRSDSPRIADEASPIEQEKHLASHGYVASKWVGEKIFMTASERGIPCNIFRLGLVWADTRRGRYDDLQREDRIFKSCLLSGWGIKDYRYRMAPTPVDYVARSVVSLATRYPDGRGVFHISSTTEQIGGTFERCNEIGGRSLELLSTYEWITRIKGLHDRGRSLPAVPLIEFAFSMTEAEFQEHERRTVSRAPRFDCSRTHRDLEDAGILTPVLNDKHLKIYLGTTLSNSTELHEDTAPRSLKPAFGRSVPDKARQHEMLRRMFRIRIFDEEASRVKESAIKGFLHNSIGQEGEIVGACAALRDDDYMTGNHRSHGHPIGKGVKLSLLMAELFGKKTGVCRGKGGSMHLAAFGAGSLGESGIVGGSMPAAVGAGLSARLRETNQVCLCFFGDGAANCGPFHESLNLAAIWKLPVIFLCENNGYADCSPLAQMTAVEDIARRADAYGIPGVIVDGQDALAVFDAVSTAALRARSGEGPTLVEAKTYRYCEHMEGGSSPTDYRSKEEINSWRARDPIQILADRMRSTGQLSADEFSAIESEVRAEVAAALAFARESPAPDAAALMEDVFA